jgi:lactoylglutathione lyase
MTAALAYLVLRCRDLERSRAFYEAIGLRLELEQHGRGAQHYSCTLGEVVLELYPLSEKPTSGLRLGLRVPSVAAILESVRRLGAEVLRVDESGGAPSAVLRDPDGHEVSLVEPA